MSYSQSVLAIVLALFSVPDSLAHDLWLIPPPKATPKQTVRIEASVGGDFPVSEVAHDTDKYPRKFVVGPDGKTLPLTSAGKKDLFALLQFEPVAPGIHVVAVETTPRIIALDADKF